MPEILVSFLRETQSSAQLKDINSQLSELENGSFEKILSGPVAQSIFSHATKLFEGSNPEDLPLWTTCLGRAIEDLQNPDQRADPAISFQIFVIGLASLNAFVQSNITGPPLEFSPAQVLLPNEHDHGQLRRQLLESLSVDGESAYRLTPNVELFSLARTIFMNASIHSHVRAAQWALMRMSFLHQRLLSETAPSLQSDIMDGIHNLRAQIQIYEAIIPDLKASFLLEIATIQLYYGNDKLAQEALKEAVNARRFQFALTGLLGKRTKFQQIDLSQLVVLAKSYEEQGSTVGPTSHTYSKPVSVGLNDDTLLDSISFTKSSANYQVQAENDISESLKNLDPEKQPQLHPLDSIILLSTASSITNTSPSDGLTREETLPYATRVLDGGSSNWQVYTQALLIRSRIEGYRARTVERGLLQLQALVDQVIADTTQTNSSEPTPSTFLPKAKEGESAPASQRLLYLHQLASPTRWELESELAARWINLGGLKSALEIYERLEMWAEVALCWAGIEREDKARQIVRKQLFEPSGDAKSDNVSEEWSGPERTPSPPDAPRLYCILGDVDKDPAMYERAWEISGHRYFRAQKSLGRYWYAQEEYARAVLAFSKAVQIKQLDHATWFAMGCALLELNKFSKASEVFSRAVQLDDQDAESWSNLAVALLNEENDSQAGKILPKSPPELVKISGDVTQGDDDALDNLGSEARTPDPQRKRKEALRALQHAAKLKRDSYRIWDNLLTVASTLDPPSYKDMISAQRRIIELRGPIDGEKCIDESVIAKLVQFVTSSTDSQSPDTPGTARLVHELIAQQVVPLITSSSRLWLLVAQLAEWRGKPEAAMTAQEKAWRVITVQPGWEHGTETQWQSIVTATLRLVEAYKTLGQMEKAEGMGAGSGELVRKDWKFKSRSAIRGIMGRAKDHWEDTEGWNKLKKALETL